MARSLTMLSNQQFERLCQLASRLAGIELVERHRELLDHRRHRLKGLEREGIDSLLCAADAGDPNATRQVLSLVTTKFTGFFRHPSQFAAAAEHALRATRSRGQARMWSAGAATGEEPYSLAMALIEAFGWNEPPVTILATDIDEQALALAERAQFGKAAWAGLSGDRQNRFLLETGLPGHRAIAPIVRRLVEFRALNLVKTTWPIEGPFDVILCRNVLMYLEADCRGAVLERMAGLLAPDGLLIQDPSEHLGAAAHLFTPKGNAAYTARWSGKPANVAVPLCG